MNYYNRYPGDLRGKVLHLSAAQEGIYNRLMDWQYENERGLPLDDKQQQMLARCADAAERRITPAVVREFFTLERDDGLWNPRTFEEIEKAQARIRAAKENGKRGGRPQMFPVPHGTKPSDNPVGSENAPNKEPTGFTKDKPTAKLNGTQQKALYPLSSKQKLPTSSGAAPPQSDFDLPPQPPGEPPLQDRIFGWGLQLLVAKGAIEKTARSFLGLMRKQIGDLETFALLKSVEYEDISDPIPWLIKAMVPKKKVDADAWAAQTTDEGENARH